MRKSLAILFFGMIMLATNPVFALLNLELTRGMSGAVPIAVLPFSIQNETLPQDVASIITNDLRNSGRFKVYGDNSKKTDMAVIGRVSEAGDKYTVSFQLIDVLKSKNAKHRKRYC